MTMEKEEFVNSSEYSKPVNKITKIMLQYGLTPNQTKVFLHLTKTGEKTASELSKNLKVPRTETYHLLNLLEQKGIVFSRFSKPAKFNSIPINEAISILIDNEKKKITDLESKKKTVLSLWDTLPEFNKQVETENNKFQVLQGRNSILGKIEQIAKNAQKSIQVLGSEVNFMKFYHTDFVEFLKNSKADLEVLTTFSEKGNYVFEELEPDNIKRFDDNQRNNFSFIIKDDSEVLFFVNNSDSDVMAIWTDSKSFVITLKSLFRLIWKKSTYILEKEDTEIIENQFEHRLREIEQEKLVLDYLQKNFIAKKGGQIIE